MQRVLQLVCMLCCTAGAVVVMSHTLSLLQQHQQPLQQCAALFSHISSFLKGELQRSTVQL
jgi:hypothetical protein